MIKSLLTSTLLLLSLSSYSQELRTFRQGNLFGFKQGEKTVIPANYEYASEFYENVALVKTKGLWGYIDPSNQFIVQAQFDQAEPMIGGLARVYKAGKVGMVDSTGKLVIPVEFDRFENGYNGLELYKGEYQGLLTRDGNYIPPKYSKLSRTNKFVVGSNGEKHDLYYNGKLLFEGSETAPILLRMYSTELIDVYKNGKAAIMTKEGVLLTDHIYSQVQIFNTSLYPESRPDLQFNYMIALNRSYIQYPENGDPDLSKSITAYDIIRADGSMLSDQPFDQVFSWTSLNEYDEPEVKLKQNGHFADIDSEGNVIVSPYTDIFYYQNVQIRYKHGKKADICTYNEPSRVIRSFNYLEVPKYYSISYDEMTGEETVILSNSSYGELIVSNDPSANESSGRKALYDVAYRQFITTETDTLPTVFTCSYFGDSKYYVLDKNGYYNIWCEGQAPISQYIYKEIIQLGGEYFQVKDLSGRTLILNLLSGAITPIEGSLAEYSETMYSSEYYENYYNPDGYNPEPTIRFYSRFVHLTDTITGKVGFLWDQTYYKPQFDSLIQNPKEYPLDLIHLRKDGKWGSYYFNTQSFVAPQFDSIPFFKSLEGYITLLYSDFSENGGFYLDIKGRKWPFLPYDVFPEGKKNKTGLVAFDVFAEDENPVYLTPKEFKHLESVEVELSFIAQNKKKKFGILNPYGDTILPLEYSSILYADLYSQEGTTLFSLEKGKKMGLYHSGTTRIIPAVFDKIEPLYTQLENPVGYLVHSGDLVGLYDMNFNLLLPCEYNGIAVNYNDGYGYQFFVLKGEKMTSIYTYSAGRNLSSLIKVSRWYDRIAGPIGYVLNEGKWEKYNHETGEYFGSTTVLEDIPYLDYFILYSEKGLYGIKGPEGMILNQANTKFLIFMDDGAIYLFKKGDIYVTFVGSEDSYLRNEW